jgi:DNA replication protein DnaC/transposase
VPEIVVPDNLRSAVSKSHRYEPDINPSYRDLAEHYGVAVVPARARKPRDKAKAEVGVQVVERWILAALRNRQFFSLDELNSAIALLLERLNRRPFRKLPGSRHSAFEALDRPALRPLPEQPYVYAEWKKARVHIDYHVEVDGHYYSVPYQLVKKQLEVRLTARTVECFHANQRVASHLRSPHKGRHSTQAEHMPKSHREHAEWTPQRLIRWAEQTGPNTAGVISHILERRIHPTQGYRACLGILRLGKTHGEVRLELACRRALSLGACSYKSLESILRQGLENLPLAQQHLLLPLNTRNPTMLPHPTLDKLQTLRLTGMLKALAEQLKTPDIDSLSFVERLGLLVDRELTERDDKRLSSRLRQARLKHNACLEDIDYRSPRGLDKALILQLASGQWLRDGLNLIINGPTGVGKTWLACALAHQACREGYSVRYLRLPRLLEELGLAHGDGRFAKLMSGYAKTDLLILDDWGLAPFTAEQRRDMLELLDDRYGQRSTLVTSQMPVDNWHELIGDPTLADAILDRLVHNAYRINLKGESMRKRVKKLTTPGASD